MSFKVIYLHSHITNPWGAFEHWSGTPGCRRRWAGRSCLLRRQNGHKGQHRKEGFCCGLCWKYETSEPWSGIIANGCHHFPFCSAWLSWPLSSCRTSWNLQFTAAPSVKSGLDSSKWGQYLDDIYLDRPRAVFAAQFPRWGRLNIRARIEP